MNHLKRRSICKKCSVVFVRDSDIQVYCNACLVDAKLDKMFNTTTYKKTCQMCGKVFKSKCSHTKFCSEECKVDKAEEIEKEEYENNFSSEAFMHYKKAHYFEGC